MGDDPPRVRIGIGKERVGRKRQARGGVDADDRAVERRRIARRAQVLAPQGAALGARRRHRAPDAPWRVAAGIDGIPVLPVVGEREARAVAGARVQRPVRAEVDGSYRVARVLLAPVLDQHLLRAGHDIAVRLESREPSADHAAVRGRAGGRRARVTPARRCARRAELVVVRVEDVDVRALREVRIERHPQKAAIPEVVDVRREVREGRRSRVGEAVEDLDRAALLGDEDPAVGRKAHHRRVRQPAERDGLLKRRRRRCACRLRSGRRRRARPEQGQHRDSQSNPDCPSDSAGRHVAEPPPPLPSTTRSHRTNRARNCNAYSAGCGREAEREVAVLVRPPARERQPPRPRARSRSARAGTWR